MGGCARTHGGAADQIIAEAGGTNIFADMDDSWTSVGRESVVRADPEVILINDYAYTSDGSAQEKIEFLTSHPTLAAVDVVQN
ncbi:ABC transporter substrate-binding protein [Parasphingorhabdus pacifica]